MLRLILLLTVLGSVCACASAAPATRPAAEPKANLIFKDADGKTIATAHMVLPDKRGENFEGKWKLLTSEKAFPASSTRSGKYTGTESKKGISIDLNPGTADNNVYLYGHVEEKRFIGSWQISTFAGAGKKGSFELTLD